jgi:hypothetical protein
MGAENGISGTDHGQGFLGVDHIAGEVFQRHTVRRSKHKGPGGGVEQPDGAGVDVQQGRQGAHYGVHHLLMIKDHRGQPGHLLQDP